MNLAQLQRKLIQAARAGRPSQSVPYAFEQRIMARLPARRASDVLALWSAALWRAAASCGAIMVLFGAWAIFASHRTNLPADVSQEFENTVLAAVNQEPASDSLW